MRVHKDRRQYGKTICKGFLYQIVILVCFFIFCGELRSQCTNASAIVIPDNGITTLQFSVSGLVDNNLSSPTQGICGVEIEFMHEYLGDLTVTLVSPAGTSVVLIGPPTTAITPTNLSVWNIDFVPCSTPASPDPGFTDAWSNLQAWQALTPYSGTYHPQSGCLENFNTGPANGLWQIIIQDHDQFQLGTVASVTLIFCNPTGLNCLECGANAGVLSPTSFAICSGENIQSTDIAIDFGGNTPPPALYAYEYLLVSGNTILQHGNNFSITPAVGNYTLCGLSYLNSDAPIINGLIAANDYITLSQAIASGVVCADLTTSCVPLTVTSKPDTLVIASSLCNGEVFSFRGQDYFSDGLFYQVYDGPGLCDTVYEIRISARTLNVALDVPDTLACGAGNVVLNASASGASGPFTFQWSTISGNITSPPTGPSVTVDQAGQYFVSVTDGICDGSGNVHVHADQGFPQVFVEGGTITCSQTSINLSPIFVPSDGTVLWTGPGGFLSSTPDTFVTIPGTYVINITNTEGCTTSRPVDIGIDTVTAPVIIVEYGKDCQNQSLIIGNSLHQFNTAWSWTGPNGFFDINFRPPISEPGLYILTASFSNGCQRTGSFLFDGDFAIPDLTVSPSDTINCNEVLNLWMASGTLGVTYAWNGPQGFFSDQASIQTSQVGNYLAIVSAPNGCQNSGTVVIHQGDDIFDFQVFSDTLNCTNDSVLIGVTSMDADIFHWVNYGGADSMLSSIYVTSPGIYTVMMNDTNSGCTISADVLVMADFQYTHFGYITDTITCNNPIAELNFVPVAGFTYIDIYWELPDLTVVPGPTLMSGLPGEHRLIGVGKNGCIGVWRINIPFDTLSPFMILETDTLGCEDTVQIISQTLDLNVQYEWSGPGIISNSMQEINVDQPGWYHLAATGLNGCIAEYDLLVDSNYVLPDFMILTDTLRCDQPVALTAISSDPILSYTWIDPGGQVIGTDSIVQIDQPGQYIFQIKGLNHCTAFDTVSIEPVILPMFTISADTISCTDTISRLEIEVDIPVYSVVWENESGDTLGTSDILTVGDVGPFTVHVTGPNGCETQEIILVPFDTAFPVPIIELIGEVRCQNRDFMLDGSSSLPSSLTYSWTTIGGLILSDPALPVVQARDTGLYFLTVQHLDNGCERTDTLHVTDHPDAITLVLLDITSPECSGDGNGAIEITNLQGGVSPILYEINGSPPQSNSYFDGLSSGTYMLTITDAGGCRFDTTIIIDDVLPFIVDAGPDLEIYLGESTSLSGLTDLPIPDVLSSQWDSLDNVLCTNCMTYDVSPLESTTYEFQITSASGCVRSDQVIVFVIEEAKYYVANIFSPNGDNINDEVRLNPSPGILKVLQWVIFDRWGNAVYGRTNFDPSDPSVFWNGQTTTGEFANPGVFPYVLEVELINGKKEVYHGDITLIR